MIMTILNSLDPFGTGTDAQTHTDTSQSLSFHSGPIANPYTTIDGSDGKVYDANNHLIGWVDNQGHVFNSAELEVSDTVHGGMGAAAYRLRGMCPND
jgi:hypothetical protein